MDPRRNPNPFILAKRDPKIIKMVYQFCFFLGQTLRLIFGGKKTEKWGEKSEKGKKQKRIRPKFGFSPVRFK